MELAAPFVLIALLAWAWDRHRQKELRREWNPPKGDFPWQR